MDFTEIKMEKCTRFAKYTENPNDSKYYLILVKINNILQNDMLNATLKPLSKKCFFKQNIKHLGLAKIIRLRKYLNFHGHKKASLVIFTCEL